jgi:hypothetical protein
MTFIQGGSADYGRPRRETVRRREFIVLMGARVRPFAGTGAGTGSDLSSGLPATVSRPRWPSLCEQSDEAIDELKQLLSRFVAFNVRGFHP